MPEKFKYKTHLIKGPGLGLFAEFPFDSVKEFGSKRAVRVKVSFDGYENEMSLLPNGKGGHWLHVKKDIRTAIGKEEGDLVEVILEKDDSPKTVEIPDYLQWLLDNEPEMAKKFERFPYSAKKFWVDFIREPKNDEAKVKRINRLFEVLMEYYKK